MTALELTALALVTRIIGDEEPDRSAVRGGADEASTSSAVLWSAPAHPISADTSAIHGASQAQDDSINVDVPAQTGDPLDFIKEYADEEARYYRATDESGEMLAAFYSDGRVRLADRAHRFAGMVENGHADLLEIADNTWSELFVSVTPEGRLQMELRGGPCDTRVFTCERA